MAWESTLRPKPCALALNGTLRNIVARKLGLDWSPEQVAAWLKLEYPDDERMRVSHETIYRSLFIQARGVLKKELISAPTDPAPDAPPSQSGSELTSCVARSPMLFRSEIDRPTSRIEPSQVIGKAT